MQGILHVFNAKYRSSDDNQGRNWSVLPISIPATGII